MRDLRIDLFDIIPYLDDKIISYATEGPNVTPGWIGITCLWCSDGSTHLGIHLDSNVVTCWKCGKHNIVSLVRVLENNCGYSKALAVMEKYQNINRIIQRDEENPNRPSKIELPKQFQKLNWPKIPLLVTRFLEFRGFDPETIIRGKELYFGGITGRMRYRLILPIYLRHRLVSFLGRDLAKKPVIPYLNLEEEKSVLPIKSTLYGYDDVPPGGNVVVVEGTLDQWKLGPGSVATYGTAWTMEQVALLRELKPNKIIVLFDSEEEAQDQAKKLLQAIWFCPAESTYLDGVKDPGDLSVEEGKKLMGELRK